MEGVEFLKSFSPADIPKDQPVVAITDTNSVIQKSIQLAKEAEERKAHPLGGHLAGLFR